MTVDYSGFGRAFGGNFADRLRLVRFPACVLERPEDPACSAGEDVQAVNDLEANRLSAAVEADADPAVVLSPRDAIVAGFEVGEFAAPGAETVFAVMSATSGQTGDYRASDLRASGSWNAGMQSGSFSYEYPIPLPPSVGGAAPSLALSYDSQSVDGMSSAENGQASWAGLGWEMNVAFIERKYKPCRWDGHPTWGDLCWHSPYSDKTAAHYVMSLNGRTTELIRDGAGKYRIKDEPGWLVEYLTGGPNGGYNGEYWRITDLSGTKYWFGYGAKQEGYASGTTPPATLSNWTVRVNSDDSGEPGYSPTAGFFRRTWRWNLDRIVDRNENATAFTYGTEVDRWKQSNGVVYPYDRAGWLAKVEYGLQAGELVAEAPVRVTFNTVGRCVERTGDPMTSLPACPSISSSPSSYPDVPADLMCPTTSCTRNSPVFFGTRWLERVDVDVRQADGTGYDEAYDVYLRHHFPNPGAGGFNMAWLDWVRTVGKYGPDDVTLPITKFDGSVFNNRVDWTASVPKLKMFRISRVKNELGGQIDVTYSATAPNVDSCPQGGSASSEFGTWYPNVDGLWDRHRYLCYPTWYTPEGAPPGFGIFHKYVVTKVVESDLVAGSPAVTTAYAYLGGAAWAYDKDLMKGNCGTENPNGDSRTWNDYRGYVDVKVTVGTGTNADKQVSEHRFFRGMNDDPYTFCTTFKDAGVSNWNGTVYEDNSAFRGRPLQVRHYRVESSGSLTELSSERFTYYLGPVAASVGLPGAPAGAVKYESRLTRHANTVTRERMFDAAGVATGWLDYQPFSAAFEATYGLPTQIRDYGQIGVADDVCSTFAYARNTSASVYLIDLVRERIDYGGDPCGGSTPVIGKTLILYDGNTDPLTYPSGKPDDGNPTEVRSYSSASAYVTTRATYDSYGRVLTATDGRGKVTTSSYAPTTGWPHNGVTVTNPVGHVAKSWPSAAFGLVTRVDDPNAQTGRFDYDGLGRLLRAWSPIEPKPADYPTTPGTPSARFSYSVTATAPPKITSEYLQSGGASPVYVPSFTYLDGLGRVREAQSPSATGTGRTVAATYYDARGNVAGESLPFYNSSAAGSGLHNAATTALPSYTAYGYDALDRVTAQILRATGVEQWRTTTSYRGDRTVSDPPRGGNSESFIDADGNVVKVVEWEGAAARTTLYSYTPREELASVTDPAGNTSSYAYDWLGQRTVADDPDSGAWTSTFDGNGNLTSTSDAKGQLLSFVYDSLNRPTETWSGPVSTGTKLVSRGYDTAPLGKGLLASATRHAGAANYTTTMSGYDPRGRATGKTVTVPSVEGALAGSYTYSYGYDAADHLISATMPAVGGLPAETVTTSFAATGHADTLTGSFGGGATYVADTTVDGAGYLTGRTLGDGSANRAFTHHAATGLLASIVTTTGTGTPVTVQDDRYAYDQVGNVTRITDEVSGQRQCYTYDDLDRMSHGWTSDVDCTDEAAPHSTFGPDPYDLRYAYQSSGNIASVTDSGVVRSYTYPATGQDRPHAVTAAGGDSYGYDANGAMTTRTVDGISQTLTWDVLHQLTSASGGGESTSFVYDADGARLLRKGLASTTLYLDGHELTLTGSNVTATRFYTMAGTRVAVRADDGALTWLLADNQMSTQLAITAMGLAVTRRRYRPFGQPRDAAGAGLPTDRGFLGAPEDDTGLVFLGARYYDPALGRFTSPDPLLDLRSPQWANPYTYAGNNPATFSDPSGLALFEGAKNGGTGIVVPDGSKKSQVSAKTQANKRVQKAAQTEQRIMTQHKNTAAKAKAAGSFNKSVGYIHGEITKNVASGTANTIRSLTYDSRDFLTGIARSAFDRVSGFFGLRPPSAVGGYALWAYKVRQGGDWDHKPKLQHIFNRENQFFFNRVPGTDKAISYDLWSNIHYGYVGTDVGIPADDLLTYGNDPPDDFDSLAIQIGIDLRNTHGPDTLTTTHISNAVLNRLPDLTATRPIGLHVVPYDPGDLRIEW